MKCTFWRSTRWLLGRLDYSYSVFLDARWSCHQRAWLADEGAAAGKKLNGFNFAAVDNGEHHDKVCKGADFDEYDGASFEECRGLCVYRRGRRPCTHFVPI